MTPLRLMPHEKLAFPEGINWNRMDSQVGAFAAMRISEMIREDLKGERNNTPGLRQALLVLLETYNEVC